MIIDITKQIGNNHYRQKNEILSEVLEWLHINVGEYLGYDKDTHKNPYHYAIGIGWKILVYRNPEQDPSLWNNRLSWKINIADQALSELFILKFL